MSGGLSWREYQILARIEEDLRVEDGELDVALKTMRIRRDWAALWRVQARALARLSSGLVFLLVACALGLTVVVVQVRGTAAYVVLGIVWTVVMDVVAAKLLARHQAGADGRAQQQVDDSRA